jgi:hypothetical protein
VCAFNLAATAHPIAARCKYTHTFPIIILAGTTMLRNELLFKVDVKFWGSGGIAISLIVVKMSLS